jgi:DNA-binding MarR family transcriptional regulator
MTEVTSRIVRDDGLKPSAKLIYLYIAAAYREIYSNPVRCESYALIADDTKFSESTVRRALKQLEDLELIKVDSGTNRYETWLNIDLLRLDNGYSLLRQIATAGGL